MAKIFSLGGGYIYLTEFFRGRGDFSATTEVNSRGGVVIFFLRFLNFRGGVCIEATDCGRGGVSEIFPSRGGVLEALPPLCPCMAY